MDAFHSRWNTVYVATMANTAVFWTPASRSPMGPAISPGTSGRASTSRTEFAPNKRSAIASESTGRLENRSRTESGSATPMAETPTPASRSSGSSARRRSNVPCLGGATCFTLTTRPGQSKPGKTAYGCKASGTSSTGFAELTDGGTQSWRGVPVRDDSGRIICWAGINLDISRLKETEEALRRREQELETLAENSPLIISRFDLRFRHTYINRAIERVTGWSREHFIGRTQRELGAPEDFCALWEGKLRETIETQLDVDFEFSYDGPLGERAFYSRLVPEFSSDGLIVSVIGVCTDVTERKALQAQVLSIAEREQQRIGQDLHDDVGQELTGVGLMAEALVDALQEIDSPEAGLAAKIRGRLEHARARIRTLAGGLIPVEVDARGLMSALRTSASASGRCTESNRPSRARSRFSSTITAWQRNCIALRRRRSPMPSSIPRPGASMSSYGGRMV